MSSIFTRPASYPIPFLGDAARLTSRASLQAAARFLRRARNRRMDAPTLRMTGEHGDIVRTRSMVVMDVLWNFMFVVIALGVLIRSREEKPSLPLRVWLAGYAVGCFVHGLMIWAKFFMRGRGSFFFHGEDEASIVENLESANTLFSLLWWALGFYWMTSREALSHDAPKLYWVCIVFLAFDVIVVLFCAILAIMVGIGVWFFLPCIVVILYAVEELEGLPDEDIQQLPRYIFQKTGDKRVSNEMSRPSGGMMTEGGSGQHELDIPAEDAVAPHPTTPAYAPSSVTEPILEHVALVDVHYKWKPPICTTCLSFGHLTLSCKHSRASSHIVRIVKADIKIPIPSKIHLPKAVKLTWKPKPLPRMKQQHLNGNELLLIRL